MGKGPRDLGYWQHEAKKTWKLKVRRRPASYGVCPPLQNTQSSSLPGKFTGQKKRKFDDFMLKRAACACDQPGSRASKKSLLGSPDDIDLSDGLLADDYNYQD